MYVNAGKVYVLQSEEGPVKVGCSKDVRYRAHTIETISGRKIIQMFSTADCSNYNFVERKAHDLLDGYRIVGEWFNCGFDTAKIAVSNAFDRFAEFYFQTEEEAKKKAEESAEYFAEKFLPKLFCDWQDPKERIDLSLWTPRESDRETVLSFLMDSYIGILECADEEAAQEYIDLYKKVEMDGVRPHKDDIQATVCDHFFAVDGEIERYYKDSPELIEIMNLTILKHPIFVGG